MSLEFREEVQTLSWLVLKAMRPIEVAKGQEDRLKRSLRTETL